MWGGGEIVRVDNNRRPGQWEIKPHDTCITYENTPRIEGIQNMPAQNMLLWHIDYFELKVLEK